jgi:hypothetical protein
MVKFNDLYDVEKKHVATKWGPGACGSTTKGEDAPKDRYTGIAQGNAATRRWTEGLTRFA